MSLRRPGVLEVWTQLRFRTSRPTVGGDPKIEAYLDKKGVSWQFHPGVDPDQFDSNKSLNNQARFQAIDEKRVDQYAEAMKRGDEFPPVIAHGHMGKLVIADGNHRMQSAIKAKKPLNVYVINGDGLAIDALIQGLAPLERSDSSAGGWASRGARSFVGGPRPTT